MKQKLSITVEKELITLLEKHIDGRLFRNKSHIIEYALSQWLEKRK